MSGGTAGDEERRPPGEDGGEDTATGRRELLAGLLAAVAGGSVLAGAGAAEAAPFKDLFDDLDKGDVKGLIKLLIRAFTLAAPVPIPPAVWGMINVLLEYLGKAGGDTMTRVATIGPAMEASYPTEAVATPIDQREATRYQAEAIRARADESLNINATVAEAQADMLTDESLLVAKAQAASASGAEGLTLLLQSMLAMQGSTNARLGMLSMQMTALNQTLADMHLLHANEKHQSSLIEKDVIGDTGAVAEAVERIQ
ncbi:MAG: hypothetical protein JNM23_04735 [Bradyrhizobiaceae bacterium]|nr:hypothetical protein [Bradyrhizobiaceae bacterium]